MTGNAIVHLLTHIETLAEPLYEIIGPEWQWPDTRDSLEIDDGDFFAFRHIENDRHEQVFLAIASKSVAAREGRHCIALPVALSKTAAGTPTPNLLASARLQTYLRLNNEGLFGTDVSVSERFAAVLSRAKS